MSTERTSERDIQNAVRLAASEAGYTLFRNNVGTGWTGHVTELPAGTVVVLPGNHTIRLDAAAKLIRNPRPLNAGLCAGSSDLIGWYPRLIGREHVGTSLAQFTAIEVKTATGRASPGQKNFIAVVELAGGIARIARSAADVQP